MAGMGVCVCVVNLFSLLQQSPVLPSCCWVKAIPGVKKVGWGGGGVLTGQEPLNPGEALFWFPVGSLWKPCLEWGEGE